MLRNHYEYYGNVTICAAAFGYIRVRVVRISHAKLYFGDFGHSEGLHGVMDGYGGPSGYGRIGPATCSKWLGVKGAPNEDRVICVG